MLFELIALRIILNNNNKNDEFKRGEVRGGLTIIFYYFGIIALTMSIKYISEVAL